MRRNSADDHVRALERRVLSGDLTAVRDLAYAYDRIGRGESLQEITIGYRNGRTVGQVKILVPADSPLVGTTQWTAAPQDDLNSAITSLRAFGIDSSIWRMGGNLRAAGVARRFMPDGFNLYITEDPSEEGLWITVLEHSPDASDLASVLVDDACQNLPRGPAGDNSSFVSGSLQDVVNVAARIVALCRPNAVCSCTHGTRFHGTRFHENGIGPCSRCECEAIVSRWQP